MVFYGFPLGVYQSLELTGSKGKMCLEKLNFSYVHRKSSQLPLWGKTGAFFPEIHGLVKSEQY